MRCFISGLATRRSRSGSTPVCINQHDVAERSHQVCMMTEIYRMVTGAMAWLGRENGHSRAAMELFSELDSDIRDGRVSVNTMEERIAFGLFDLLYAAKWEALCVLLQRSYWRRLWIIREITVAREVVLLCGWDSTDLSRLRMITLVMHRLHTIFVFDYSDVSRKNSRGWVALHGDGKNPSGLAVTPT